MNTLTNVKCIAIVVIIISSQWLSQLWLANTLSKNTTTPTVGTSHPLSHEQPTDKNVVPRTVVNIDFSDEHIKKMTEAISQMVLAELQTIKTSGLSDTTQNPSQPLETVNAHDAINTTANPIQTEEAYKYVSSVIDEVIEYGEWSNEINIQLQPHISQLTMQQRQQVMKAYVQAFREGRVPPSVAPPF